MNVVQRSAPAGLKRSRTRNSPIATMLAASPDSVYMRGRAVAAIRSAIAGLVAAIAIVAMIAPT